LYTMQGAIQVLGFTLLLLYFTYLLNIRAHVYCIIVHTGSIQRSVVAWYVSKARISAQWRHCGEGDRPPRRAGSSMRLVRLKPQGLGRGPPDTTKIYKV